MEGLRPPGCLLCEQGCYFVAVSGFYQACPVSFSDQVHLAVIERTEIFGGIFGPIIEGGGDIDSVAFAGVYDGFAFFYGVLVAFFEFFTFVFGLIPNF